MPGILCEHCTAVCCRYIALPLDTPTERGDFDDIRWYLLHENISVFVEDGEWYICMHTSCRHLRADFRCGIYATRPRICRAYGTDNCDYHSGDYGWEHHFTCPEHLDDYVRSEFKNSSNGKKKTVKKKLSTSEKKSRRKKFMAYATARPAPAGPDPRAGRPLPVLGAAR